MRSLGRTVLLFVLAATSARPGEDAASRRPVAAEHGMIVTADSLASAAGLGILLRGGNAIDAAVAAGFALAVTYPEAGNIGGGGFMLIRTAAGKSTIIDFRETAPSAARRDMYLDETGTPVSQQSLLGPLATGIPGTVAGLLHALTQYGTMSRDDVIAPALRLAADGFPVNEQLAASLAGVWHQLCLFPSTMKVFSRSGIPFRVGDTLRQPDLAATLRAVIDRGQEGFYGGPVAASIIRESERHGGIIAATDLRDYRSIERLPLRGTYRGYEIITVPPPSSGGILLLQILNFLEQSDLHAMGWNSSPAVHVFASACQRAFADRMAYLGDPDFVSVPVDQLISKRYAAARWSGWDSLRAAASSILSPGSSRELRETTHYCVADRWGNVVSVTVTLNDLFGCKTIVDGSGFFLNNEMDDFAVKTGSSNIYGLVGGEPNLIAPGKRMLSSMTPTIVLKNSEPILLVGARGGSRIPTTTAQIVSNIIDFGMDIQGAVGAARVHHQWVPDTLLYDRGGLEPGVLRKLGSMGYSLQEVQWTARAEALFIDPNSRLRLGGPDPREHGVPLGY